MPRPLRKDYYNEALQYSYANHHGVRQNRAANTYSGNYAINNTLRPAGNTAHIKANTVKYPSPVRQNPKAAKVPKRKLKKGLNPLQLLIKLVFSLCFFAALVYYVFPYNFVNYFEPMLLNRVLNKNVKLNAKEFVMPTAKYLANSNFNNERLIVPLRHSKAQMVPLAPSSRFYALEDKLNTLALKYPQIQPSIYVWDYTKSRSAEINSNAIYPSASIIKLPILVELLKYSESLKKAGYDPIDFHSKLQFNEIYRTEGSGTMQYEASGVYHSIHHLASIMIQSSDNSATNMLLEQIGGMEGLNSAARNWGLPSTQMTNWLPDLKGTNTVSAKDMATLLYNIDNPKFLNSNSKYAIQQYMSNVHNTTLIKAGLPKDAEFLHKTGDIGTMLGDAGIVYAPSGRKYIVVILTKRNFNDYSARDFIQQASSLIYKSVIENADVY